MQEVLTDKVPCDECLTTATVAYTIMSVATHLNMSNLNTSPTSGDYWADKHVCDYLDNVTNTQVTVTCGLDLVLPPFLFLVGLVSNVLVILVMRSKSFRPLSTSFYMIVNAATDSASLLVTLPAHYVFVNFPGVFDNARDNHAMCSFFNVFGWGTSDLGVLFTAAMTTERAIAVKYPLKAHKLCTTRRAKMVVVGLTGFELVKLSHFFFKSVVSSTRSRMCDVDVSDQVYASFYNNVWPWLHFSIMLVSYGVVVAGNVVIFVHIRRSASGGAVNGVGRKSVRKDSHSGSRNRQMSVMLMIDSITLVVCTLPFSVTEIMKSEPGYTLLKLPGGKNLVFTVTFYLLYLNRCLNFFLYCISGSRFRAALGEIFHHLSHSSALNVSATRQERSMSVSKKSDEANDDTRFDKSENNSITLLTPDLCSLRSVHLRAGQSTLPRTISSQIFRTVSSANSGFQRDRFTDHQTLEPGSEIQVTVTRL